MVFASKSEEVAREWRKLPSEELHSLYFPPDNVRAIRSRRVR